jgi:hypothetical protein
VRLVRGGHRFTAQERAEMESHTLLGAELLRQAGLPPVAHQIALYHHERWDGGGYPRGLSGEGIPLSARVIAAVVMMPLLGLFASLMSIIGGGLLCWIVLDIPPATFVQRLREVTPITDFWVGMVKAPVFGAIIAMAGCFQGMQVQGNAEQVGLRTTAAVVQAIFLVIVLDAFFAVFFSEIGWD